MEIVNLDCGIRLVYDKCPHSKSVSVGVWIGSGTINETEKFWGISHFIEHMLFKGTKVRTAKDIAVSMDKTGGQLNAFTAHDCTCVYSKTLAQDLDFALELIADMLLNSKFDKKDIATEKTIGYWDLPSMVISHSMAIAKNEFFRIGGFPEWISGWGGEDIVIGFLAVAAGNPIMMTDSVSYHIQHPPYSGSEQQKIFELKRNIEYYRAWANNVDEFPIINAPECKKRGKLIDL